MRPKEAQRPVTPVAIGRTQQDLLHWGEATVVREGLMYTLRFPLGMTVATREFYQHAEAVDNSKPVHRVWARFDYDGHEVFTRCVMTFIAYDEIHLCT